ncbi:cobalamin B12-binding domain-containing protein [Kitasatospora sp. NPDC086801]|uniref:cobalamin B12-binding domain-containing protein n=1 Tax=Kitasatospora sp. NPDC086801 TaxID=3364066 RepID=UPI003808848B
MSIMVREAPIRQRPTVVVSGVASDAHTWNLAYLQMLIEELGYPVVNLGPCVPDDVMVERCLELSPALIALGSVNGHGYTDGLRVAAQLRDRAQLADVPLVIGGNLGTAGELDARQVERLFAAGFDAVFQGGQRGIGDFRRFVNALRGPASRLPVGEYRS